jgi:hypothetical protein
MGMPYPVGHRAEVKRKIRDACTAVALQLGAGMKATNLVAKAGRSFTVDRD